MSCRVVLVSHYFPAHRGGVEIVAGMIAQHLSQQEGFHIDWFAAAADTPPSGSPNLCCHPVRAWNVTEHFGLPWPIWGIGGLRRLKAAVEVADVVHLHDFIYPGSIAAFLMARRRGIPIVVTQHVGSIVYRRWIKRIIYWMAFGLLRQWMIPRADRVIFVSERVREEFLHNTHFSFPPEYWPNGVDGTLFTPVDLSQRKTLREKLLKYDAPVVLFVGRFVERKGLKLLSQLVEAMPDVHGWFAGRPARKRYDPRNWERKNLQVFIDCDKVKLADLYRAADLMVLPSYGEGYPLVVQEALACGTPVLIPPDTAAGAPEAASHVHICPLVPHENVLERWQKAIMQLLEIPRDGLHQQALADFAHQQWSWEKLSANYASLFNSLQKSSKKQ